MSLHQADKNSRPDPDKVLTDIADYVMDFNDYSELAYQTAFHCLMDTLGCGFLALKFPECTKMLGPVVEGTEVPNGNKVPGTGFVLDPIKAAFDIGTIVRWLDFNDTWLAAEWGHPSDNLGAIMAVADYINRQNLSDRPVLVKDLLHAMIKAHEIQGVLALENSFNKVGLDHVVLVKVASTAVVTAMLGGSREDVINALSQAWVDGQSLRTYRHAPNTGSRKSWAAGDATSRAVRLALITLKGEMGYPSALSAKTWGFYDVCFKGQPFSFQRDYGSYVMENVLFKISFPAEFHAQTAVEGAIKLHPSIKDRVDEIEQINLYTHESAVRIISKTGPLHNPADRDHCLQYMVAIGLLYGELTAEHYEDNVAGNPEIDVIREKMRVFENEQFSKDYHDPDKRSIANSIEIVFKDGSKTDLQTIEYPVGHRNRRNEGIPLLKAKFENSVKSHFDAQQGGEILNAFSDVNTVETMPVDELCNLLAKR